MNAPTKFPLDVEPAATIGKAGPTPADLTITVRDQRFGREKKPGRWWLNNDPVATAWHNALSATFPRGEAFFIEAVKAHRDGASPKLEAEIRAFVKQEINHTREHIAFNRAAVEAGYDLDFIDQRVAANLELTKDRPAIINLAVTMALEHYTAMMAHEFLANPKHFAGDAALDKAKGAEAAGKMVASLMTGPEAARVVMIETTGWDTHAGQNGRLAAQLGGLDAMLGALRDNLGAAWNDTMVVVATEFGRTAAINGTGGTDHGTGGLAMLLGGTVRGGRVLADWPGLGQSALHEGRDLRPTTPLDTVLTGAIASHFGLEPTLAAQTLFPGGTGKALSGLIRT